jgi:hypothetical protein
LAAIELADAGLGARGWIEVGSMAFLSAPAAGALYLLRMWLRWPVGGKIFLGWKRCSIGGAGSRGSRCW